MKTLNVKLIREWDGHPAGETVTVWEKTAESMVQKRYGTIVRGTPRKKRSVAQTATAKPANERADNPPTVDLSAAETATKMMTGSSSTYGERKA